jgi:cobyrinic acid a,c-diamide synthase
LNPVVQLAGLSVEPVIVTVGVPHASEAVGATIPGTASVQLRSTLAGVLVNTGAFRSAFHVRV